MTLKSYFTFIRLEVTGLAKMRNYTVAHVTYQELTGIKYVFSFVLSSLLLGSF